MKRLSRSNALRLALAWAFAVLFTVALLEVGLRLLPQAVPTALLRGFAGDVRLEIAQRRHLPNESQTYRFERDDGGPPLFLFEPNSRVDFYFEDTGVAGQTVMDGLGFCSEPGDDAWSREVAIVAVGDSFTVCYPPDPSLTWPPVLGRVAGMSVYNLGRGGYGPHEYIQLLKRFGLAKRPQLVVMQIYEGNDLRDALWFERYVAAPPEAKARFPMRASLRLYSVDPSPLLENPFARHSYAYNLIVVGAARGLSALRDAIRGEEKGKVDFRYRLDFPERGVAMNLRNTDKDEVRTARELRAGTARLDPLDDPLADFAQLAREHGFQPILSYAPSAHTAYAEFVRFDDPELAELMPWFSRALRDHLRARAGELGIPFVDLTPALQRAASELRGSDLLYFPINLHFTPAGHEVAAREVARVIAELRGTEPGPAQAAPAISARGSP